MPDVAELFPALAALNFDQLNARRRELLGNKSSYDQLDLDALHELSAISTLLRRKASGPPRDATKPSKANLIKSLTDLNV